MTRSGLARISDHCDWAPFRHGRTFQLPAPWTDAVASAVMLGIGEIAQEYARRVARETVSSPIDAIQDAVTVASAGCAEILVMTVACSSAPLRRTFFGRGNGSVHAVDPAFGLALEAAATSIELRTPPNSWLSPPPLVLFQS